MSAHEGGGAPRQLTLARLAELGIRPDRDLGQHFLLDDNVLRVIDRLAELDPADVALEIGAGVGVLTAHLARVVAHVHAIEIDRRLEPALDRSLEGLANVDVHWGDAMRLDLGALVPAPTAFVSNLPYHVAAPLILDSIGDVAACTRWCALVQREVADRLTASPGAALYGGPSVLRALALDVTGRHQVSRRVFVPQPNVDSTLVAFRRRDDWPSLAPVWDGVRTTVQAAFSHRRKTLANALTLAGWAARADVEAACRAAGLDPGVRAEALPPEAFVELAARRP
jgi:16S rRNA (adenine1518-N6/adenine1519-N6)-dimethyltransferase